MLEIEKRQDTSTTLEHFGGLASLWSVSVQLLIYSSDHLALRGNARRELALPRKGR